MFNLSDEWIINPVIKRFESPKKIHVIKRHLQTLDKGVNKYHLVKKQNKDICVYSYPQSGYLFGRRLSKEIKAKLNVNDFAFIERKGDETYCLVFKDNQEILESKFSDTYKFINAISLIKKKQAQADNDNADVDDLLPVFIAGEISTDKLSGIKNITQISSLVESLPIPDVDEDETERLELSHKAHLPKLRDNSRLFFAGGLIAIVIAGFLFWASEEEPVQTVKVQESPFKTLETILEKSGVNVKGRMIQAYLNLNLVERIEGWKMERIELNKKSTQIVFSRDGGSYERLVEIANKNNFLVTKVGDKQVFATNTMNASIMQTATLIPLDQTITYIEQAIENWLPQASLKSDNSRLSNQKWKETFLKIQYQDWGKNDFDTLGTITNGHPISFESGTINYGKDGYNGVLKLIIYGN